MGKECPWERSVHGIDEFSGPTQLRTASQLEPNDVHTCMYPNHRPIRLEPWIGCQYER